MKTKNQNKENKEELKDKKKESIEIAAERLAEIIILWIESNKIKNDNYEKRK